MSPVQIFGVLVVYVMGAIASVAWSVSIGAPPPASQGSAALLGFVLWTSFFGFCNATAWAVWWREK